jgi:monoamine oxidase
VVRHHTQFQKLLKKLGIQIFEQMYGENAIYELMSNTPHQLIQLPQNQESTYRIKNGTSSVIQKLSQEINIDRIKLNTIVSEIIFSDENISVLTTDNEMFHGSKVINTIPPNLFNNLIKTKPALPKSFLQLANNTHTWMGESIKIGFSYAKPFWKTKNLSGTIFSNVGPITEMYEHATFDNQQYAIKGFFNSAYHQMTKQDRKKLALNQLEKYYGTAVHDYSSYHEKVWQNEPFTFAGYDENISPHYNNGHQQYQESYFNNRLYFAGAETNSDFPGYMEGAVRSAFRIVNASFD